MRTPPTEVARRGRRAFWITLLLAFAILGTWSVASPHMASPDEPAHAAKAAATVRGQFAADESQYRAGRGTFELPALFQQGWDQTCFAFKPDVPASCAPAIGGDLGEITPVESHVARYNPVYYALIGLPTLLPLSEWTFVVMRLVSALINAALIALTFRTLVQLRRPEMPVLGTLAAMTPMTLFIGSSMTPQGPEIFGAMLVTVTLLSMVFEPRDDLFRTRSWTLVAGTAFFALARGLSPVYLLIIILIVLAAAPSLQTIRAIIVDRRFWVPLGVCGGLAIAGIGYTLLSGSLALGVVYPDPALTARDVVVQMVRNTDYYLEQILGAFGWGDTHLSLWVLILIGGTALIVGVLGLAFATCRGRIVLLSVVAVSFALPIVLQLASFHESGMVWQGKYVLPLAMVAPVLAGFLVANADVADWVTAAILRASVGVVAVYQVAAVAANIHRYANGASGPWFELIPNAWTPVVPIFAILAVQVGAWIAVVLLLRRLSYALSAEESTPELNATSSSTG